MRSMSLDIKAQTREKAVRKANCPKKNQCSHRLLCASKFRYIYTIYEMQWKLLTEAY